MKNVSGRFDLVLDNWLCILKSKVYLEYSISCYFSLLPLHESDEGKYITDVESLCKVQLFTHLIDYDLLDFPHSRL